MIRVLLALVTVLSAATLAEAQVFVRQTFQTCPNGQCGQPSGPMFAPVACFPPQAMPAAKACPAGVCGANCPCPAGACPGACPTTTPAGAGLTYSRPLFPRAHAFLANRPRLFFR